MAESLKTSYMVSSLWNRGHNPKKINASATEKPHVKPQPQADTLRGLESGRGLRDLKTRASRRANQEEGPATSIGVHGDRRR